jgi:hypothetical protein
VQLCCSSPLRNHPNRRSQSFPTKIPIGLRALFRALAVFCRSLVDLLYCRSLELFLTLQYCSIFGVGSACRFLVASNCHCCSSVAALLQLHCVGSLLQVSVSFYPDPQNPVCFFVLRGSCFLRGIGVSSSSISAKSSFFFLFFGGGLHGQFLLERASVQNPLFSLSPFWGL